ncbi:MAG: hypothetical protein ACE14Q_08705 [Acidobacteriota bacterium]
MDRENNLVKAVFQEEDFNEFSEIEKLIKEAKPTFEDNFEKEVARIAVAKRRGGRFLIKSALAASLLIGVISLALLFFKPVPTDKTLSVSSERLNEVLKSVGGREELRIDDILSLVESNQDNTSEKFNNYVEYYFGESDEENFS